MLLGVPFVYNSLGATMVSMLSPSLQTCCKDSAGPTMTLVSLNNPYETWAPHPTVNQLVVLCTPRPATVAKSVMPGAHS
jgi:hypothetical protein